MYCCNFLRFPIFAASKNTSFFGVSLARGCRPGETLEAVDGAGFLLLLDGTSTSTFSLLMHIDILI